jgi:hypothetical protein
MNWNRDKWIGYLDRYALRTGVAALLLCMLLGLLPPLHQSFFRAYLFGWLFWLEISLGGMALTMLHYLTGGEWGVLIRPITFSAARVMPLLFVLFVPIFFGLAALFPWARPEVVAHDPILQHLRNYLNPTGFCLRFVLCFVIWCGLVWAIWLTPPAMAVRLRAISAGGLVLFVLTMTLAGVDWIMSRQLHWSSSVFGFIVVISQTFTALCFTITILWLRSDLPPISQFAKPCQFNDLGNLVLTLVILWAYMNFSQFLVTWTGNEHDDVGYYVARTYGGWRIVAGIIVFVHFLASLIMLLFRDLKQNINRLGIFCLALLALRVLDLYWTVAPMGRDPHEGFVLSPLDILAWIGIGGIWYAAFSYFLNRTAPLALPVGDEQAAYGVHAPNPD